MSIATTLDSVELSLTPGPWTEQDYLAMPEAEGLRVELVDGVLIVLSQPESRHQSIGTNLTRELRRLLPDHIDALPAVNVRLGPDRIVGPDITVTLDLSEPKVHDRSSVLLVVEIVSPHSRRRDRVEKPSLYSEAKIPWYLVVEHDPKLDLTLHRREGLTYVEHATAGEGEILELAGMCSIEVDALLRRR